MVIHTCNTCFKVFNKKSSYLDHINNKKKPCKQTDNKIIQSESEKIQSESEKIQFESEKIQNNPENPNNPDIINLDNSDDKPENKNVCVFCFNKFSTTSNLYRHLNTRCKVKKLEDEKKQNILENLIEKDKKVDQLIKNFNVVIENNKNLSELTETLKKQNEELLRKNEELEEKINKVLSKNTKKTINNTSTTNNTQNITNNNIIIPYTINPFGKETFKKINKKDFLKIVTDKDNNGSFCFNRLIDLIHFNNKIPENQNIYMNDYNRGLYMIHDGKEWNLRKDEEFIIFSVLEHVRDLYNEYNDEELEEKLESDPKFNKNFQATFKKYFDYVYDEVDDKELDEKELKTKNDFKRKMDLETKNKLYNKRHIPKDNYDKLQNIICKVDCIEHK